MDHHLNTLLEKLKNEKTKLTIEGQSFSPASLFSAIQHFMSSEADCHSSDFQKIMDISKRLTNVNNLIEFCETILRKMESTETLNPNEKTFLEYISMVSQILGMTLELEKIQESTDSIFSKYKQILYDYLIPRISMRFNAFMKFMTYSYYFQAIVRDKKRYWETKKSGSPSTRVRAITPNDNIEIQEKKDAKDAKIQHLSDEYQKLLSQKNEFLEKYCQLFALVSKPIREFGLKSSPELSFFLSSFDTNHFDKFLSNFRIIDEKFQLFKTEIDAFNQHVESLKEKCLEEYKKPDEYLDKWNSCIDQGLPFYGKKD